MSTKTVYDKIKNMKNAILAKKLRNMSSRYHVSIEDTNVKVPRIMARNNVRKIKRVTFKNLSLSNSPLSGSPLYVPVKNPYRPQSKNSKKIIKRVLNKCSNKVPKYTKRK